MSHPQPPQRQSTPADTHAYTRAIHNTALAALVVCPILVLLPPRKLDIYTIGLVGTTLYSANYLHKERGGTSVWEAMSGRMSTPAQQQLPRQQDPSEKMSGSVVGEMQRDLRGQREAWKVQRQREIRADVEEGKGFGDMIMGQVWDVWNWGKTGNEEEEEKKEEGKES